MFDVTPLTVEEITDQCRALAHAVIELENPEVKEILSFMLAERPEHLHVSLDAPCSYDDGSRLSAYKTSKEEGNASGIVS